MTRLHRTADHRVSAIDYRVKFEMATDLRLYVRRQPTMDCETRALDCSIIECPWFLNNNWVRGESP